MSKFKYIIIGSVVSIFLLYGSFVVSAPDANILRSILPEDDSTYNIGSSILRWYGGWFDNVTTTNLTIDSITSECLETDANGNVIGSGAACGSGSGGSWATSSSDYWYATVQKWSTSSSDFWETLQIRWSTTSVDYWETTQQRWATTSADYWESTQWRWATSSEDNYIISSTTIPNALCSDNEVLKSSSGSWICGTDNTGGGSGEAAWENAGFGDDTITPTTTDAGIFVTGSSTIDNILKVNNNLFVATSTKISPLDYDVVVGTNGLVAEGYQPKLGINSRGVDWYFSADENTFSLAGAGTNVFNAYPAGTFSFSGAVENSNNTAFELKSQGSNGNIYFRTGNGLPIFIGFHHDGEVRIGDYATDPPTSQFYVEETYLTNYDHLVLIDNNEYYSAEKSDNTGIQLLGIDANNDVLMGAIENASGKVKIFEDGLNVMTWDDGVATTSGNLIVNGHVTSTLSLHSSEICLDNDCRTAWPTGGSGTEPAWQEIFDTAITPTTTNAGIFVTGSSTIASNFRVDGDATTTGHLAALGGNSDQWNLAYSWGNHADAGYSAWSTSSSDYWETAQWRWATTSADNWLTTKDTGDLTEGSNLYYTDERVGDYIDASSTIQTYFSNAVDAYSWGDHSLAGYFLLSDWYATTTDGLDEGSTNLYYTDNRVANYVNGSSTIAWGACADGEILEFSSGAWVCGTDDTGAGGGSNWQNIFTNTLTPTSTGAGFYVTGSSTVASNFRVDGDSQVTGDMYVMDNIKVGANSESISYFSFSLDGDDQYIEGSLGVNGHAYFDFNAYIDNILYVDNYVDSNFGYYVDGTQAVSIQSGDTLVFGEQDTEDYQKIKLQAMGLNAPYLEMDSSGVAYFVNSNVGIGDETPSALFTVGDGDLFTVDTSGNIYTQNNLYVGSNSEGIANAGFTIDGDDTYIHGMLGVNDNAYFDNDVDMATNLTVGGNSTTTGSTYSGTSLGLSEQYITQWSELSNYFDKSGIQAWEQAWSGAITPTTTNAGIFVTGSSTIAANFRVDGSATTTGNLTVGDSEFDYLRLDDNVSDTAQTYASSSQIVFDAQGIINVGSDYYTNTNFTLQAKGTGVTGQNPYWSISSMNNIGGILNTTFLDAFSVTYSGDIGVGLGGNTSDVDSIYFGDWSSKGIAGTEYLQWDLSQFVLSDDLQINGNATTTGHFAANANLYAINSKVGIGTQNPLLQLYINGSRSKPATSGTTPNGILAVTNNGTNGLYVGVLDSSPWGGWLQSADGRYLDAEYPLILNPNGGNVLINTTTSMTALTVDGASTITGAQYNAITETTATPYNTATTDYLVAVNTTGGAKQVNLPDGDSGKGRTLIFINSGDPANNLTLHRQDTGETICGDSSDKVLSSGGHALTVQSNGSGDWYCYGSWAGTP